MTTVSTSLAAAVPSIDCRAGADLPTAVGGSESTESLLALFGWTTVTEPEDHASNSGTLADGGGGSDFKKSKSRSAGSIFVKR